MTFKYREGEAVRIKEDRPALGLRAGDIGVVWALYEMDSPAYEVSFRNAGGDDFDLTASEDELVSALAPSSFSVASPRQPATEAA